MLGKLRQHGPPRRIGERGKRAVQGVGSIVNHMVKYKPSGASVKGQFLSGTVTLR